MADTADNGYDQSNAAETTPSPLWWRLWCSAKRRAFFIVAGVAVVLICILFLDDQRKVAPHQSPFATDWQDVKHASGWPEGSARHEPSQH